MVCSCQTFALILGGGEKREGGTSTNQAPLHHSHRPANKKISPCNLHARTAFLTKHFHKRFVQSHTNVRKYLYKHVQLLCPRKEPKTSKQRLKKKKQWEQKKAHAGSIKHRRPTISRVILSACQALSSQPSLGGMEINKATRCVDSFLPQGMPPNKRSGQTCSWPDRYQWVLSASPRSKVLTQHARPQATQGPRPSLSTNSSHQTCPLLHSVEQSQIKGHEQLK